MSERFSILLLVASAIAGAAGSCRPQGAPDLEALELRNHPRLWVRPETLDHLAEKLHTPYLRSSARRILGDADWLVHARPIAQTEARTQQQGTRAIASHLQTLTAAFVLTRDLQYRAAAIRHLANVLEWRHISCEASPQTPLEDRKFFCLSYGEHAADIALMYDVFRPDMTPREAEVFDRVLDRFYLWQALRACAQPPWWVDKEWSNWNGVCAGGIGMLALALYDDRPEARKLIPFVEKSLSHYFRSYVRNGGGNHEGTGYWNYGMHYAIRYLLSFENATGRRHPAFDIPELGKSLHFPVDFHRITFGDNDGWHPTGMYFMMAERTGQPSAALRAAAYLLHEVPPAPPADERDRLGRTHTGDILYAADCIPTVETMRRLQAEHAAAPEPVARVYEGLGWATLADDSAFPHLRLSVRGGSSRITGHGHLDLLSIKCAVDGQRFIEDQHGGTMAVNFTGRGHDLYSRSAAAKSTLFVEGLGCGENCEVTTTEVVDGDGLLGIRLDASRIYLPRWRRRFIGRLVLQVDSAYWLVIDSAAGRGIESRYHTYADLETGDDQAQLTRDGRQLTMTFASLSGSVMQRSTGMPTYPAEQTRIIRWMCTGAAEDVLHVTALNPGDRRLELDLARDDDGFTVQVSGPNVAERTIELTSDLKLRQ